jgi:hypothetical protein
MENLKPCQQVLIVEDQYLIPMMIEDAVIAAGFDVCDLAACRRAAGKTAIFKKGNPEEVASGVSGALGVMTKPVLVAELGELVSYAAARCAGGDHSALPPRTLHLFG